MREFHFGGDAAPVFDGVAGDQAGIGGGAAGDDDDLVDAAEDGLVDVQLVKGELAVFVEAAHQGVTHSGGLVVDFLLHEGVEATLFGCCGVPFHLEGLAGCFVAVEVNDGVVGSGDGDDLVVCHLNSVLGVVDKAGYVGTKEVFALAQTDDQR